MVTGGGALAVIARTLGEHVALSVKVSTGVPTEVKTSEKFATPLVNVTLPGSVVPARVAAPPVMESVAVPV